MLLAGCSRVPPDPATSRLSQGTVCITLADCPEIDKGVLLNTPQGSRCMVESDDTFAGELPADRYVQVVVLDGPTRGRLVGVIRKELRPLPASSP